MAGPGICVLCLASEVHLVFNPVAPYGYLLLNMYLFIADITNPDSFVWCYRTWISLDITRFCEEQRVRIVGLLKTVNLTTIAGGGKVQPSLHSSLWPFVVHQPASPSIWPAVHSLRRGLSTNSGVTMWCSWRDVCRVCECYRGGIMVMDVFWRRLYVSILWGMVIYLFWVGQGWDKWAANMWWRCAHYLLLPLVARCLETIDVCMWRKFIFMSVVVIVGVYGNVCCVAAVVKDSAL